MGIINLPSQMVSLVALAVMFKVGEAGDTNIVFSPCADAEVRKLDGFTFGLAFSAKESFFTPDQTQLSPCDTRLALASKHAQLAVFRPKVDEISLLTINSNTFNPVKSGGYMVAFAGQKYAARSSPIFVADDTKTITKFTLVLEFQKGILQNLFWIGCDSCSGDPSLCLNNHDCAVPNSNCIGNGGPADCNIGIQLAFSGTDKNLNVLNSWYEVKKLQQTSLYGLFTNIGDTITGTKTN